MYMYKVKEDGTYEVGYLKSDNTWVPKTYHQTKETADREVSWLNSVKHKMKPNKNPCTGQNEFIFED